MNPTTISMDSPDPTKIDQNFLVNVKINNIGNPPYRKLECSGHYDKKTVDAILTLMGLK
jgi:hypothetical protein